MCCDAGCGGGGGLIRRRCVAGGGGSVWIRRVSAPAVAVRKV